MKRLITLIVLSVALLCNVNAQDRPAICGVQLLPNNGESWNDDVKSFITKMYEEKLYEDYDFLQKHCSAEFLIKLQDAYPYDADSVAYATWLFRSGQQDSRPDSNGLSYIQDVKTDKDDWYILSAVDRGWEFTKKLKVFNENGKIVISDICPVEE